MSFHFSLQGSKGVGYWLSKITMIFLLLTLVGFSLVVMNRSVGLVSRKNIPSFSAPMTEESQIIRAWTLVQSFQSRATIDLWHQEQNPEGQLQWMFWFAPESQNGSILQAGYRVSALVGTLYIMVLALGFSLPLGMATGVYLLYFSQDSFVKRFILGWSRILSALPPVLYGLLGFWIFYHVSRVVPQVRGSLLAAGVTLGIYLLPGAIHSVYGSLSQLDTSYFTVGYSLGGGTWKILHTLVLPKMWPKIGASFLHYGIRAVGDAAAILLVTTAWYVSKGPEDLFSPITSLPVQLARWTLVSWPGHLQGSTVLLVYLLGIMGLLSLVSWFLRRIS